MAPGTATPSLVLARRALQLLRDGKTRRAARVADQAARLAPGPLTFRLHAAALREAGRGARSLVPARAALAAAPGDPGAAFSVARSLASIGRVDEALAAFDELLGRAPDHAPALRVSGELLLLREPAAAERRLRRACQAEPRSGLARLLLSEALLRQGREDEAEVAEKAGLALDAALREAHEARRSARGVGVVGLLVACALAVALWVLSGQIEQYWPGFGTGPALVVGVVAPLLPLLLIGWMAAKLALSQVEPPDADLEALERVLGFEPDPGSRG
jgi:tetratricopeptide (TPR) repeat protein